MSVVKIKNCRFGRFLSSRRRVIINLVETMKQMAASSAPRSPRASQHRHVNRDSSSPKLKFTAERLTLLPGFLSGSGAKLFDVSPSGSRKWFGDRICDDESVSEAPPKRSRRAKGAAGYSEGKSVFKEIRAKFARKLRASPPHDDFNRKLVRQLKSRFAPPNLARFHERVLDEIESVNCCCLCEGKPIEMSTNNRKRNFAEEEKENFPMKFPYVPPSGWVFQTPPNRKLNYSHATVGENRMRPAVIEKKRDAKVVHEMKEKIDVDLTGFHNKQEVPIDKRYMMEVAAAYDESEEEAESDSKSDPFELENYFMSLTCRPKKVVTAFARNPGLKRKRDIFDPQPPNYSTENESFKPNFTFLNNDAEESFTFKFTNTDGECGATTGHLFDFEGNQKNSFNFRM